MNEDILIESSEAGKLIKELKAERDSLREQVDDYKNLLINLYSYDPETHQDLHELDNGSVIGLNTDYDLGLVVKWVKDVKAECAVNGGRFDSVLRCVSEGGKVMYIDPEGIELMWDKLNGQII